MAEKQEFELLAPVMSSHRDSDGTLHRYVKGDMVPMDPDRARKLGPRVFALGDEQSEETVSDPTGIQATIPSDPAAGDAPGMHIDKHPPGEQPVADPNSANRAPTEREAEETEETAPKDVTEHQGSVHAPDTELATGSRPGRRTTGRR